jgi:hypothetical protein
MPSGHRAGGEHDATECQQRNRAQVETKFTPAHGHARQVDQRRQDSEQHQFRRQLDTRQAWCQRKQDAGSDKKNRGSGVEPACEYGDDDQDCKQQ